MDKYILPFRQKILFAAAVGGTSESHPQIEEEDTFFSLNKSIFSIWTNIFCPLDKKKLFGAPVGGTSESHPQIQEENTFFILDKCIFSLPLIWTNTNFNLEGRLDFSLQCTMRKL